MSAQFTAQQITDFYRQYLANSEFEEAGFEIVIEESCGKKAKAKKDSQGTIKESQESKSEEKKGIESKFEDESNRFKVAIKKQENIDTIFSFLNNKVREYNSMEQEIMEIYNKKILYGENCLADLSLLFADLNKKRKLPADDPLNKQFHSAVQTRKRKKELTLLLAVEHGLQEEAHYILENEEVSIDCRDDQNYTPLMLAACYGSPEMIDLVAAYNPNKLAKKFLGTNDFVAFLFPAYLGNLVNLKHIIRTFPVFSQINFGSINMFLAAVLGNRSEIIHYLREINSSLLNPENPSIAQAFFMAASQDNLPLMEFCVEIDPEVINKQIDTAMGIKTAFVVACRTGAMNALRFLVEKDPIIWRRAENHPGLETACLNNRTEVILFLHNLDTGLWEYLAPNLLGALINKKQGINAISNLLQIKPELANVDIVNGARPLHYAAEHGNYLAAKILLNFGANQWHLWQGRTPCSLALRRQNTEVFKLLTLASELIHGVKRGVLGEFDLFTLKELPNLVDQAGSSLLYLAIQNRHKDLSIKLLNAGASLYQKNNLGLTPLDVLFQSHYLGLIVEIYRTRIAQINIMKLDSDKARENKINAFKKLFFEFFESQDKVRLIESFEKVYAEKCLEPWYVDSSISDYDFIAEEFGTDFWTAFSEVVAKTYVDREEVLAGKVNRLQYQAYLARHNKVCQLICEYKVQPGLFLEEDNRLFPALKHAALGENWGGVIDLIGFYCEDPNVSLKLSPYIGKLKTVDDFICHLVIIHYEVLNQIEFPKVKVPLDCDVEFDIDEDSLYSCGSGRDIDDYKAEQFLKERDNLSKQLFLSSMITKLNQNGEIAVEVPSPLEVNDPAPKKETEEERCIRLITAMKYAVQANAIRDVIVLYHTLMQPKEELRVGLDKLQRDFSQTQTFADFVCNIAVALREHKLAETLKPKFNI